MLRDMANLDLPEGWIKEKDPYNNIIYINTISNFS